VVARRLPWTRRSALTQGNPDFGEFDNAVLLKTFGEIPDDFRRAQA
jgi:hypothetical protein